MAHPIRLAAIVLVTFASVSRVFAGEFAQTVFFGDSLTDSGQYRALGDVPPGTGKFTTNPGPVWSENVATYYETTAIPSATGGTNYAIGGARVTSLPGIPPVAPTATATPVATQIANYLATTGGVASSHNLYTVWGGANDIFFSTSLPNPAAYVAMTAGQDVALILGLQEAGAKYIIVPSIPDIGDTPFGRAQGPVGAAELTGLSMLYNTTLYQGLADANANIIPFDTFTLLHEVTADPAMYGFINVTAPACGATPSLLCTAADFVVPDADQTYLFADDVHPTTAGHQIFSDFVISTILAPHQISMLPESEVKVRIAHVDLINLQLEEEAWLRTRMCQHYWGSLNGQKIEFDANNGFLSTSGTNYNATIGADFGVMPELLIGGAVAYGSITPHWGEERGKYRQEDLIFSAYAAWRADQYFINGIASYGTIEYDLHRKVPLGRALRHADSSTDGRNWSLSLLGGYEFKNNHLTYGPMVSWLYQNIHVDSLSEDGGSIALLYHDQERTSNIGSVGWYFTYEVAQVLPYLQILLNHDFNDDNRLITAESVDLSPIGWTSPAFQPGRTWVPVTLGVAGRYSKKLLWNVAVQHDFGQENAEVTSIFLNAAIDI